MNKLKIDKIVKAIEDKLKSANIPDDATGKMTVNLQSGGVSGDVTLEIKL